MNEFAKPQLNEIIHAPNRLRICAFLDGVESAEFSVLREMLGVADSVMSKQLKVLEGAGYLTLTKDASKGRIKTWAALTRTGRSAYTDHVKALKALVGDA